MKIETECKPQLEQAVKELERVLSQYRGTDQFRDDVFSLLNRIKYCLLFTGDTYDGSTEVYGHAEELLSSPEIKEVKQSWEDSLPALLVQYEQVMREWKIMQENNK